MLQTRLQTYHLFHLITRRTIAARWRIFITGAFDIAIQQLAKMFFVIYTWKQLRNGLDFLFVTPSVVTNWRNMLISCRNDVILKSFVTLVWRTGWMGKVRSICWFVLGWYSNPSTYLWGPKSEVLTAVLLKIQGLWAVTQWPLDVSKVQSAFNFRVKQSSRLGLLDSVDRFNRSFETSGDIYPTT